MMKNLTIIFTLLLTIAIDTNAQLPGEHSPFSSIQWREIGPYRGGRSCAVTGVPGKPNLYYFGSTGGGIWKTTDGGRAWENISDGFFGSCNF